MIRVVDLHKSFGETAVLRGISAEVRKGEVCVLLGPSGGGKSTLLRAINGLDGFDRGRIEVDGLILGPSDMPHRESVLAEIRRRVGMVFQQFHLFPHRSVIENVIEGPVYVLKRPAEEARQEALALLDRVGMREKADAMPRNLSGGQQQRVAIARALAMQPEAILFDEPTSALDPRTTAEVIRVMGDLAKSGQTMVVVTHAMDFARHVAHTVHVMSGGRIVESGPPSQIFEDPRTDATRAFLAQGD